jgi:streptogramin lyase
MRRTVRPNIDMIPKLHLEVALIIALATQAACGSNPAPAASQSASPAAVCQTIQVKSTQAGLAPSDSPTTGFSLPAGTEPVGIVLDKDTSSVWVLGTGLDQVIHVADTGQSTTYQLPKSGRGIQLSQGTDGTVWIPEQKRDAIAGISADGTVRECSLPGKNREPVSTSVAADGTVWVAEAGGGAIARLVDGKFTEYPIGRPGVKGAEVIASSAGGAWFSVFGAPVLGRVSDAGKVDLIPIGGSGTYLGLLETPDGAVWVADFDGGRLVRVARDGSQLVWTAPSGAKPQSFAIGPAGVVWVTESGADTLARVEGSSLEQVVKTGRWPDHMVITPDAWAWFTEYYGDRVGRVRVG